MSEEAKKDEVKADEVTKAKAAERNKERRIKKDVPGWRGL